MKANEDFGLPASTEVEAAKGDSRWVDAGTRQEERQRDVPAIYKTTLERLACELAMRMEDPAAIFESYGYTPDQASELLDTKSFSALVDKIRGEVVENGLSFKAKIKAVAEDLIPHMYDMATDPLVSSAVRADIGKWAAKLAGHEPVPAKAGAGEGGGGFSLSITFAGQAPQQIVAAREPATIDHSPGAAP